MIYYISLDNPHPSGGVKTQYRHVEILNEAGLPASMLHLNPGFRADTWFESKAPVAYNGHAEVGVGDSLVWPEILRSSITKLPEIKQYIFNQNIHYTWRGMKNNWTDYDTNVDGTMVLTDFEREWLSGFVPNHRIAVVRHGIDPRIFSYDGRKKKQQIAFMPRKHPDEAEAVFGWLYQTRALKGWNIVEIDKSTEKQTAEILKDSAIFFAFGYPEGGTLPPFEAAACGCNIIGYGGFASDDLVRECYGRCVPSGDTCKFVNVARDLLMYPDLLIPPQHMSDRALSMFTMQKERESLIEFFN